MKPRKRKPREKTYCPGCQLPRPGYTEKVCKHCQHGPQCLPQAHLLTFDGRTLNLGGKVKRRPGCE